MNKKTILEGLVVVICTIFILCVLLMWAWITNDPKSLQLNEVPSLFGKIELSGLLIYGFLRSLIALLEKLGINL